MRIHYYIWRILQNIRPAKYKPWDGPLMGDPAPMGTPAPEPEQIPPIVNRWYTCDKVSKEIPISQSIKVPIEEPYKRQSFYDFNAEVLSSEPQIEVITAKSQMEVPEPMPFFKPLKNSVPTELTLKEQPEELPKSPKEVSPTETLPDYGLIWDGMPPVHLHLGITYLHKTSSGEITISDSSLLKASYNNVEIRFHCNNECQAEFCGIRREPLLLNGEPWNLMKEKQTLRHGDIITIYGKEIQFVHCGLLNKASTGKQVCKALKECRQRIADANNIPFATTPCAFQGDCPGTCPACDKEAQYLADLLNEKKQRGEDIILANCSPDSLNNLRHAGFQISI